MARAVSPTINLAEIKRDMKRLVEVGPRFPGTPNERQARDYITARLREVCAVEQHEYSYTGWAIESPPRLRVVAPEAMSLETLVFIHSPSTPEGGLTGRLEYLGIDGIIRLFSWEKFLVRADDGRAVAFITGRQSGPPIPQPIIEEGTATPHLMIGEADAARLRAWCEAGTEVTVHLEVRTRLIPDSRSHNIIGRFAGSAPDEKKIVFCAHYDSMYICPGANDNAGGVSCLLALARHFSATPPPCPVELILFCAEEWDLVGSRAYVRDRVDAESAKRIRMVLNMDGVAGTEKTDTLHVWAGPEGFLADLKRAIDTSRISPSIKRRYSYPPLFGSDHVPFYYNYGIPAAMFTFAEEEIYHLPEDVYQEAGAVHSREAAILGADLVQYFGRIEITYPGRNGSRPWPGFRGEPIIG